MPPFAIAAVWGGSKGALYRETLKATGFYVGRIVIATAEFAPMPYFAGYPGGRIPTAIGYVFPGMTESFNPIGDFKRQTRARHRLPPMSRLEPEKAPGGSHSRPSS